MRKQNLLAWFVVAILGIMGTVQYHSAQFYSRFDTFFGDRGDARGFAYFCEHWYQAFLRNTNLLSPGIFYPAKGTLAYSDLLLGYAIPYSLLRAVGVGMFSSVEIVVIVLTFLNYVACFILLNKVLRFGLLASCAGAMFFAFNSPKFFQTGHLQLQFVLFLPLMLICVISFIKKSENLSQRKATLLLSLAALFLELQLLTSFYHAWFFVFWSFLFLLLALVFRESRLFLFDLLKKYWPAILASAAIFVLEFIPFLLTYLPTIRAGSWYAYDYVSLMIPEWWSLLSMGDGNYVWGWLSASIMPDPPPATWGELKVGVGLIPSLAWILITVWAVWLIRKHAKSSPPNNNLAAWEKRIREAGPTFLGVMILSTTLFYLLGFRYNGHSAWYFVHHFFPGAGAIRAIARYVIFLTLPMAIAFAYILDAGLQWISRQKSSRRRTALTFAIVLLAALGVIEQFGSFKVGGTGFSKKVEEAYLNAMVAKLPRDCKAFYITPGPEGQHNPFEYQYDAMLISIMSGIPTLNASSSQFPPNWSLYLVKDPDYESNVKKWISLNHIDGKVCRLEIGPQVEAFDPRSPSAVDDPEFFVRQHYHDFLSREPTSEELNRWIEQLTNCKPNDSSCDRVGISQNLFHSTGFYDTGSFILRLYEVGLGRMPRYDEFVAEMTRFRAYLDSQQPETAKSRFIDEFVKSAEFVKRYEGLSDLEYQDKVLKTSQASPSDEQREPLIGSGSPRVQILKKIVESDAVSRRISRREFVVMQYFGYLRRDPEPAGFEQWLALLDNTGDFRKVTSGFVNSVEYRQRFQANH